MKRLLFLFSVFACSLGLACDEDERPPLTPRQAVDLMTSLNHKKKAFFATRLAQTSLTIKDELGIKPLLRSNLWRETPFNILGVLKHYDAQLLNKVILRYSNKSKTSSKVVKESITLGDYLRLMDYLNRYQTEALAAEDEREAFIKNIGVNHLCHHPLHVSPLYFNALKKVENDILQSVPYKSVLHQTARKLTSLSAENILNLNDAILHFIDDLQSKLEPYAQDLSFYPAETFDVKTLLYILDTEPNEKIQALGTTVLIQRYPRSFTFKDYIELCKTLKLRKMPRKGDLFASVEEKLPEVERLLTLLDLPAQSQYTCEVHSYLEEFIALYADPLDLSIFKLYQVSQRFEILQEKASFWAQKPELLEKLPDSFKQARNPYLEVPKQDDSANPNPLQKTLKPAVQVSKKSQKTYKTLPGVYTRVMETAFDFFPKVWGM